MQSNSGHRGCDFILQFSYILIIRTDVTATSIRFVINPSSETKVKDVTNLNDLEIDLNIIFQNHLYT